MDLREKLMVKRNKFLASVILILLVAMLIFIFANSLEPVAKSKAKSMSVMEQIKPILELFIGEGNVTDHIVRKIAHFLEYTTLGVALMLFAIFRSQTNIQNVVNCLSFGLASAVTDESLQMLTDRGPMVKDVLLDFLGVLIGVFFVFVINLIAVSLRKNRKKEYSCEYFSKRNT